MLIIALLVGMVAFYFLKTYGMIGIAIAGFLSGIVAKGPLNGLLAGLVTAVLCAVIFIMPIPSPLELFGLATSITGHTIAEIDPLKLTVSIFSISGVLIGTVTGLIGGIIRH